MKHLALILAAFLINTFSARGEELGGSLQVLGPLARAQTEDVDVRQAVDDYLKEIEAIEKKAAADKAAARKRLLERIGKARTAAKKPQATYGGMIGTATINGEFSAIAFHYHHAKLFPRELIRDRFHKDDHTGPFPSVAITLVGYVDVPADMTVKIWHAAGGVNADHGELFVGGRRLGIVGDDAAKHVIYLVELPRGKHEVRWVLTGGMFQHSYLKFANPRTEAALRVIHTDAQRRETRASEATEIVKAAADPSEWPKLDQATQWQWVPVVGPDK